MKQSPHVRHVLPNLIVAGTMLFLAVVSIGAAAGDDLAGIDPQAYRDAQFSSERIAGVIKELESKDVEQRIRAIESLGELGPEARAAVPKLIQFQSNRRT